MDDSLEQGARWDGILFGVAERVEQGRADPADADALLWTADGNWHVEGSVSGTPPDRAVYVAHGFTGSEPATWDAWAARVVNVKSVNQGDVALLKVDEMDLPTVQLASEPTVPIDMAVLSVGSAGSVARKVVRPYRLGSGSGDPELHASGRCRSVQRVRSPALQEGE